MESSQGSEAGVYEEHNGAGLSSERKGSDVTLLSADGEGLVKVHMTDITSTRRRVGEANLCVQVGTYERWSTISLNRRGEFAPSR